MKASSYPALRGLLPYIFGIFLAEFSSFTFDNGLIYIVLSIIIIVLLLCFASVFFRTFSTFSKCLLPFLFFFVGFLNVGVKKMSFGEIESQKVASFSGKYVARITDFPVKKEKTVKVIAKIENPEWSCALPSAVLYLEKDSLAAHLSLNDVILVDGDFQKIAPAQNPFGFDYHSYMARKGVYYTSYIPSYNWTLLVRNQSVTIMSIAHQVQTKFSDLFSQYGLQGDEYSIITAILLGNDDTMDPQIKSNYAAAGVSHILCVSGMHVGIIFMILNFLLKPLDYSRRLSVAKSVLLLLAIWSYACITGLSPSVKRAATMFTFVTLGSLLHRHTTIYHSLFASLFILLLINPLLIFEIGFEMSYLAVFGIVIFQSRLASVYSPKTKIGTYFWGLVSVSIAAQLATFPLSIYYFGLFPNYFLLANMSVISLSFVVVVTGVALLAVSFVPPLATAVGWLLSREIKLMNWLIMSIATLPFSTTDQIPINFIQVLLLYAIIFVALFFLIKKRTVLKYSLMSLIIIFLSSILFHKYQTGNRQQITFYHIEKMSVVGVNQGGKGMLLLDSAALTLSTWYDFNVKNHERQYSIQSELISIDSNYQSGTCRLQNHFLRCGKVTVYFLSRQRWIYPESEPIPIDYLYVMDNPKIPFGKVLQTFDVKNVIIDCSNSSYYENRWRDSCAKYQIPYYSLREKGYLSMDIEL